MSDKKSMDFIDSSCFCSILWEPFHWTWRMPGGGKMGVHWDAFTMATFHVKLWVLALTSPVRSIQGLPSLEITGVNLHKVFSGKCSLWRWPFQLHEPAMEMQVGCCSLTCPPHGKNCGCWVQGSSGAFLLWSTSWQSLPSLYLPWWPPSPVQPWPAAVCSASWTMDHDTFLGVIQLRS